MGQGLISAFNNCWINNRNNYDWILYCDNDEFLNFEAVPLVDLVEDVMNGRITDGKTQVAILKAARLLEK